MKLNHGQMCSTKSYNNLQLVLGMDQLVLLLNFRCALNQLRKPSTHSTPRTLIMWVWIQRSKIKGILRAKSKSQYLQTVVALMQYMPNDDHIAQRLLYLHDRPSATEYIMSGAEELLNDFINWGRESPYFNKLSVSHISFQFPIVFERWDWILAVQLKTNSGYRSLIHLWPIDRT